MEWYILPSILATVVLPVPGFPVKMACCAAMFDVWNPALLRSMKKRDWLAIVVILFLMSSRPTISLSSRMLSSNSDVELGRRSKGMSSIGNFGRDSFSDMISPIARQR